MDQVTNWPEDDHQRWAAQHNGVEATGTAADSDTAHAKAMIWLFQQFRKGFQTD